MAIAKQYQFFLSYSRRDALEAGKKENVWFAQFRENLIRDVAREAKLPTTVSPDDVGFYDREGIKTGAHWNDALEEGLQSSNVLVCLYSANYFSSEYCGKEFHVFSERLAALRGQTGQPTDGQIIPVLWDAPCKLPTLPDSVKSLQFDDAKLGADYAEHGVMYLLRMQEEKAYQRFLMEIATRIAGAATRTPPRVTIPSLDSIPSAFHPVATQPPAVAPPPVKGVKAAWLIYVAGSATDYQAVRANVAGYGSSGSEWLPYHPDAANYVGALATNVVSGKNLIPAPLAVTQQLVDHLHDAEDNNTMAVIIVDPWSIYIKSFEDAMNALDRARLSNCGVIVLWNTKHGETTQKATALESRLKQTFSRIWTSKDVYFQPSVESEDKLKEALGNAIDEIRRRIADRGNLLRGESKPESFPQLHAAGVAAAAAGQVMP